MSAISSGIFKSLYVSRPLLNGEEVRDWYRGKLPRSLRQVPADDMHVTVAYSLQPLVWPEPDMAAPLVVSERAGRHVKSLGDAVVLRFEAPALERRWRELRSAGATWEHDGYQPHVSLAYLADGEEAPDVSGVPPFPGSLSFGPEIFAPVDKDWKDKVMDQFDKAIVVSLPVLVKARPVGADGRRIVEVEASCEDVDYDGDVILQSALLGSAEMFVAQGTLDIDHISEIGHRLQPPIPDPSSYIVGRPIEVKALPGNRTSVVGEIRKSLDGTIDPVRNRFDEFWLSFQSEPPLKWYSSVYGFLKGWDDCRTGICGPNGPTRFLVREFAWKSLAFTRQPKNLGLKGAARIVAAKAFLSELSKDMIGSSPFAAPSSLNGLVGMGKCDACGVHETPSLLGYRRHFGKCMGLSPGMADIYAHALMHKYNMDKALWSLPPGSATVPAALSRRSAI